MRCLKLVKNTLVKNAVVTRSNKLIEARYKLSVIEQKIIYAIVSIIDSRQEQDFPEIKFNVKDLAEFCGIPKKNAYRDIEESTRTLLSKVIVISELKRKIQTHWVQSAIYDTGTVVFELDKKLKPYLLELKSQFTSIKISELISFKSQYSGRVFELLYQHRSFGQRNFTLTELKELLCLDKTEYTAYNDFRRFVIEPVVKDINKSTSLDVGYEVEKNGLKVVAINFFIHSKPIAPKEVELFSPINQTEICATLSPEPQSKRNTPPPEFKELMTRLSK